MICGLLADKTRVVVTHQLRFVRHPAVNTVVVLGVGGAVLATGTCDEVSHALPADLAAEEDGDAAAAVAFGVMAATAVAGAGEPIPAGSASRAEGATAGGSAGSLGPDVLKTNGLTRLVTPAAEKAYRAVATTKKAGGEGSRPIASLLPAALGVAVT